MHATSPAFTERHILAQAAHELRNALWPLSNAVDLLHSTTDPARRASASAIAKRQLSCIQRLLTDMSEADSCAQHQLSCERLVLQQLVEECVAACGPLFAARGQHASSILGAMPVWVEADPLRLTQVLSNLMSNASKYTPRGGHIRISCVKANARTAAIEVADDGAGISPENLQRIFQPSYREERAKGMAPGSGLGLSVVRTLVRAHGGTVRAESRGPGTGSRFVVHLPLLTNPIAAA